MNTAILVRHGETDWNKQHLFRGRTDIPLNENGRRQARLTAALLRDLPVEAIYCSPLSRAAETAREIAAVFNREPEICLEFTDLSFGEWEGMPENEVKLRYPREYQCWRETPHLGSAPGGESPAAVQERAWDKLQSLTGNGGAEIIVVVTHRIVLKLLLLAALGLPQSKLWTLQQDPCAVNILKYNSRRWILCKFNESCHLGSLAAGILRADF
ncbi:MAG: histidine phosphatase family protein [Bacillota bacterium]